MIEYRKAEPTDAEAVALLHVHSWRESYRGEFSDQFLDQEQPRERLRVWSERLANPPGNQLVQLALDEAGLAGFVCVYGDHDPRWGALVDNLHVATASKRGGIGSSLMRQAGAWLGERGAGLGIYLWVLESNSPARRFYEHLGARGAGVTHMETHGGAMVRSCRYTWPNAQRLAVAR
jgi:ribosomal protein S18 acetylase RimI-like enzyme